MQIPGSSGINSGHAVILNSGPILKDIFNKETGRIEPYLVFDVLTTQAYYVDSQYEDDYGKSKFYFNIKEDGSMVLKYRKYTSRDLYQSNLINMESENEELVGFGRVDVDAIKNEK